MQDLAAIAVLGLSQGTAPSPWAVALLALLPARRLVHRLLDVAGHGEILLLLGIGLALAGGYGFEALGLSGELGALVLGALLADHPKAQEMLDALWGLKEAFLVGFFLLIGMSGLPGREAFVLALVALALLPLKGVLFYGLLVGFKLRARRRGAGRARAGQLQRVRTHRGAGRGHPRPAARELGGRTGDHRRAVVRGLRPAQPRLARESTRGSRRSPRDSNAGNGIRTTNRSRSARRTS